MGLVRRWQEARAGAVIAECGTGKTLISLGAVHTHAEDRRLTALAMVPQQLVEKWARESFLTLRECACSSTPTFDENAYDHRVTDPYAGLRVAITGGTSGLGLALVQEFLAHGASVAFVSRVRERVERVAREHRGSHGIVGDVSVKDDIYPTALQITGELGGLEVLINNASDLGPTPVALLGDTAYEDLERALATNVLGPFRLTLAASAREGRGAVVLNISSDAAINAYPHWGAYEARKAALRHLTRIWNEELAAEGVHLLSLISATWTRRCTRSRSRMPSRRR